MFNINCLLMRIWCSISKLPSISTTPLSCWTLCFHLPHCWFAFYHTSTTTPLTFSPLWAFLQLLLLSGSLLLASLSFFTPHVFDVENLPRYYFSSLWVLMISVLWKFCSPWGWGGVTCGLSTLFNLTWLFHHSKKKSIS